MRNYRGVMFLLAALIGLSCDSAQQEEDIVADPKLNLTATWDQRLCLQAQEMILGRSANDFSIVIEQQDELGFQSAKVSINTVKRQITVQSRLAKEELAVGKINGIVSCKMAGVARVNTKLGLERKPTNKTCGMVNERTFAEAWATLSAEQQDIYLRSGMQLEFVEDTMTSDGGAWTSIKQVEKIKKQKRILEVSAVSLETPWLQSGASVTDGVKYCKLLSKDLMRHWLLTESFVNNPQLLQDNTNDCLYASSLASKAGSCLFWFQAANQYICQDYTGWEWNRITAEAKCSSRHRDPQDWERTGGKDSTLGGFWDGSSSCSQRDLSGIIGARRLKGRCVLRCQSEKEYIWNLYENDSLEGGPSFCNVWIPGEEA